jgi:hypothetical protein
MDWTTASMFFARWSTSRARSRSRSSASCRSVMSVFEPNQVTTEPCWSRIGTAAQEPAVLAVAAAHRKDVLPGLAALDVRGQSLHDPADVVGLMEMPPAPSADHVRVGAGHVEEALAVPVDVARRLGEPGRLVDVVDDRPEERHGPVGPALGSRRRGPFVRRDLEADMRAAVVEERDPGQREPAHNGVRLAPQRNGPDELMALAGEDLPDDRLEVLHEVVPRLGVRAAEGGGMQRLHDERDARVVVERDLLRPPRRRRRARGCAASSRRPSGGSRARPPAARGASSTSRAPGCARPSRRCPRGMAARPPPAPGPPLLASGSRTAAPGA